MKITNVSYSLSEQPKTILEWETKLFSQINSFIENGSKIILYPELCLMGLSEYINGYDAIADYITNNLQPKLSKFLHGSDLCLCLGSGPRKFDHKLFNSSPIWVNNTWIYQDKIHLTPWENDFEAGSKINYFKFHKFNMAVIICFDIEQPGIALALKKHEINVVLVPSATTNLNGNQRVNRCASGRSIELGALVVTSPLVGNSNCDLIDHSEGRQGFFLPAQEIVTIKQENYSEYSTEKTIIYHFEIDPHLISDIKIENGETKPYLKTDLI